MSMLHVVYVGTGRPLRRRRVNVNEFTQLVERYLSTEAPNRNDLANLNDLENRGIHVAYLEGWTTSWDLWLAEHPRCTVNIHLDVERNLMFWQERKDLGE